MTNCKSCNAEIVWLKTRSGANIPVDANDVTIVAERDHALFDSHDEDFVAHHATCPTVKDWRKK